MLRLSHQALGSLGQQCPVGWSPSANCPADYKTETNAQGCQRCVRQTEADKSSSTCIRTLQFFLIQQGTLLGSGYASGYWNPETERALDFRMGPGWRSYPGGACGILASLQIGDIRGTGTPTGFGPGFPGGTSLPNLPAGVSPTMLLLGGVGVVVLILLLKK